MLRVQWRDTDGIEHSYDVDHIEVWLARGGGREHPDGAVFEGYRDGMGVFQLHEHELADRMVIKGV